MHECVYMYMYVCMYIYMYTHMHNILLYVYIYCTCTCTSTMEKVLIGRAILAQPAKLVRPSGFTLRQQRTIIKYIYVPRFLGICAFYRMRCAIQEFLECTPLQNGAQSRNFKAFEFTCAKRCYNTMYAYMFVC